MFNGHIPRVTNLIQRGDKLRPINLTIARNAKTEVVAVDTATVAPLW